MDLAYLMVMRLSALLDSGSFLGSPTPAEPVLRWARQGGHKAVGSAVVGHLGIPRSIPAWDFYMGVSENRGP